MQDQFPGKALIVDDHPLYCSALAVGLAQLNPACQIEIAGNVADARAILARDAAFDLVMLDLMMPDSHGLSVLSEMRSKLPAARIVIVSSREEAGVVQSALSMGADGFIGKSTAMPELVEKLHRISVGHVDDPVQDKSAVGNGRETLAGLSPAQMRILVAMADGRLNKQIAHDLNLAEPTVKSHLSAIFRKLGVGNRTQAILVARALLPPDNADSVKSA